MPKRKISVLLLFVALQGCVFVNDEVDNKYFIFAQELCKDNEGLNRVYYSEVIINKAYCNNGAIYQFTKDSKVIK